MQKFPEGKFMTTVKIGPKGQIVIPKEVRDMFGVQAGDSLILMADKGQGIAIQPFEYVQSFWEEAQKLKRD